LRACRYQLYIWLEREVEALKQLCNYGQGATLSTNEATVSRKLSCK
jgi:hypothetical protein